MTTAQYQYGIHGVPYGYTPYWVVLIAHCMGTRPSSLDNVVLYAIDKNEERKFSAYFHRST